MRLQLQMQETKSPMLKNLPKEDLPYEKCLEKGPRVLSDRELLAVIIRCGIPGRSVLDLAGDVLGLARETAFPGLLGLMHLSLEDLMQLEGIGQVRAIQLQCIGELSRRIASSQARNQICFNDPDSIAQYYMEELRHEEQEQIRILMLDSKNHIMQDAILSKGTVNASLITPREVFVEALRSHAVSIILIHNHPSGDPSPSECDRDITERILKSGETVGIGLLDHIIIGDQEYFSFRKQGLIFQDDI